MDKPLDINGKFIMFHGLSREEAVKAMEAIKQALAAPKGSVAFGMTTETNLSWTVEYLIDHVLEEHEEMTGRKALPRA